jgi:hypothetical protein
MNTCSRWVRILVWAVASILVTASSSRAQQADADAIKNSDDYFWGQGVSQNEKEASDAALAQLSQSISARVTSEFEHILVEDRGEISSKVRNIMSTYASTTLKNVHTLRRVTLSGIEVLHYMLRSEVRQIFEARKRLVESLFDRSSEAEASGDIGNALKGFYFAIVLMNSIPDQVVEYNGVNLTTELPARITRIIAETRMTLRSDHRISPTERELVFSVEAFGRPVRSMEIEAWDGTGQVTLQALDGEAVVRLYGASVDFTKLDAAVKYTFYEGREEIKEVAELWDLVPRPSFKNEKNISLTGSSQPTGRPSRPSTFSAIEACPVTETIRKEMDTFRSILFSGDQREARRVYARDPFLAQKLADIMKYNSPMPLDDPTPIRINKTYDGWEARKLKVMTGYPSLRRHGLEYLVLDFGKDGRINDVNFGIMDGLYETFVEQGAYGNDWDNRQIIIKFVERYRTAVLGRNMALLEDIFADDAVIIVGRISRKTANTDVCHYAKQNDSQPDFETIRYTKQQYLRNQKRTFDSQRDIFVGFSSFNILRKNSQPGLYGITMRQSYQSTGYADEGHLFLLVDFALGSPQIYVRAWQPKEWMDESLVKLGNFRVNR